MICGRRTVQRERAPHAVVAIPHVGTSIVRNARLDVVVVLVKHWFLDIGVEAVFTGDVDAAPGVALHIAFLQPHIIIAVAIVVLSLMDPRIQPTVLGAGPGALADFADCLNLDTQAFFLLDTDLVDCIARIHVDDTLIEGVLPVFVAVIVHLSVRVIEATALEDHDGAVLGGVLRGIVAQHGARRKASAVNILRHVCKTSF